MHQTTRNAANQRTREGPPPDLSPSLLRNLRSVISTGGGAFAAAVEKTPAFRYRSHFISASATDAASGNAAINPIDNVRTIHHSTWHQQEEILIYRVTGNGFLHRHMVRNLVGTFVEAAANRISADEAPTILSARNRSAAAPTAPASGLSFLVKVEYK